MKRFVSLPIKVIVSLIVSLAFVLSISTWQSIKQIEQDFKDERYQKVLFGKHQYELHTQLVENQLKVVVELIVDASIFGTSDGFDALLTSINDHIDILQLYLDVDNIWFFSPDGELTYSSTDIPLNDVTMKVVADTFENQAPETVLYCDEQCAEFTAVPIMNEEGQMAVLMLSSNLVNIFYNMKKALNSELSMSYIEVNDSNEIVNLEFVIITSPSIEPFIQKGLTQGKSLNQIVESGVQVTIAGQSMLINLLPVSDLNERKDRKSTRLNSSH